MNTHTFVEFRIPAADLFASLIGVKNDLNSAKQLCVYFEGQFDANAHPPMEVVEAFSIAILIRYCRAFSSGVRCWPKEEALDTLRADQQLKHNALLELRNKHMAHSVNELEEHRLQARYTLESFQSDGFTSISAASYMLVGLGSDDIEDIKALCASLLSFVENELRIEGEKLLPIVRGMTLEQLKETIPPLTSPSINRSRAKRRQRP